MPSDQLDRTFGALAHPARRQILSRLTLGQASVTELAQPFAMSQPAISKHLKVLELAGLVERGHDAQWRPCTLRAVPLKQVADWVGDYRRFWDESLDRLDDYLRKTQAREASHD
ncbi:MAG TPA: metalloregulator ArsR/SmtB family transcription factor [Candidatus Dormibacteraeota bacterium]|nr:metalloregulator ArsR/SmtB family transcription factor [Candidatus Dormibacteraeota bacterium]